ncbi:unnamed protein product [Paramecium primaurelia]|uniref:Uncharacterized protein n=1 Tax=Paramecium primaurelia TaxID=5886 RepID=A0A8S1Q3A4_PARPR|nr:unnamed protein product [Paramecium primaurelia]CAD8109142.1 unnamed protein product [Paramecium primaurelia]
MMKVEQGMTFLQKIWSKIGRKLNTNFILIIKNKYYWCNLCLRSNIDQFKVIFEKYQLKKANN